MDDRKCQTCGATFSYPYLLQRHITQRRAPCRPPQDVANETAKIKGTVCRYCGKQFARPNGRSRHESEFCRKKPADKAERDAPDVANNAAGGNDMDALKREHEALKAQVAQLMAAMLPPPGQALPALPSAIPGAGYPAPAAQGQAEAGVVQNVETQVNVVDARVQNVDARTYVTVVLGELEKADLGALAAMVGRIGEEKREGAEAAWRWMLEGARAVHGGAAGGLLVPNKKEDKVLRVRGGRWSEEQTAAAVKEPTERLLWELVSSVNRGLMKVHWTELPEKEGPYLGLDRGLKGLMDEKREELVGRGGPLYAVGVENAADWRREGKKMPKPGEAAELKVEE